MAHNNGIIDYPNQDENGYNENDPNPSEMDKIKIISVGSLSRLKLFDTWKALNADAKSGRSPLKPLNGQDERVRVPLVAPSKAQDERVHIPLVTPSKAPLNIIDLPDDCLEQIIRGFALRDIINVAGTCVRLNKQACTIFQQLFRQHEVFIDCDCYPVYRVTSNSRFEHQRLFFGRDLANFFNRFGETIAKLTIRNMRPISAADLEHSEHVDQLIMKYCRKNLLEIRFETCGEQSLTNKTKPFEKVTNVTFDRCQIGSQTPSFEYLFPCMEKLTLNDCSVTNNRECIQMHFPHLRTFNLIIPCSVNSWTDSAFRIAHVEGALNLNPNIQNLGLRHWNETAYDAKLLQHAAAKLPNLKSLHLWHLEFTEFYTAGEIHFTSVRRFTLDNLCHVYQKLDKNLSRLTFDGLSKFNMFGGFDTECMSFVARHSTIKKLKILPTGEHEFYPKDSDVIRFASILPNLQKIIINGKCLTTNGLLEFIRECKLLILIVIRKYAFSTAIRNLFHQKCIELGWNVSHGTISGEPEIILKRKL